MVPLAMQMAPQANATIYPIWNESPITVEAKRFVNVAGQTYGTARTAGKGAYIKSLKDTWLDTTSSNPHSQFLLIIISAFAQLERDLISQRTKEGLKAAKARGRKGGRPSIQNKYRDSVIAMYRGGMKISEIVTETKISRSTVKRIIKSNKERFK